MDDSLTTGSKRLAGKCQIETSQEGCDWGPCHNVDPESIANDPGIKALVQFAEIASDSYEQWVEDTAKAAIKTWEDGHA